MLETSLPIRLQAVHDVNLPPFVEWMINFGKTVVKAKIIDRVSVEFRLCSRPITMNIIQNKIFLQDTHPQRFGKFTSIY